MAIILSDIKKLESTSTLKSWRETINQIRDFLATLATKKHTSETTEFGGATSELYGHVMLLDNEDNEYDSSTSRAVTPKALYNLKENSILKGYELTKENNYITSIDGKLIFGNIDLGSNVAIPDDIKNSNPPVSYIRASHFIGTTSNALIAVKAEKDIFDREFEKCYVLKENLQDLTTGKLSVTNDLYISYINSENSSIRNSVVCKNDGSKFQLLVANNDVHNIDYIPLQFDLATAKNEYTGNTVSGKMTIGGDLHSKGTISADGKVYNAVWNDYAEFFEKGEETEVGDIVALDIFSDEEKYVKASKENPTVIGVHSDSYGYILGGKDTIEESEKTHIPVGLVGRVKAKIVGKIKKGEFVVLSGIAGVGCAYDEEINNPLDVIGIAVETSNDTGIKLVKIKLK